MLQNNVHYIELSKFNEVCGNLEKQITELQEVIRRQSFDNEGSKDKLHRRNLQIAELKKSSIKSNSVATEILVTAIKWLQGQEVNNPFRGCRGIDCDEVNKAINSVNKVCSL